MAEALSIDEARKLVLHAQRLPPKRQAGPAVAATLSAIGHLGYVQIDTISVVQRAHHHTLWNRNPRYRPDHLDQLLGEGQEFEYWSHAAAYLPMRDYRFSLPKKHALASGERRHWFDRDERLMGRVLERITREGPLMARDFDGRGKAEGAWETKPAKQALENLFMQGDLMVPRRVQFQKVYDLTERVLPAGTDTSVPDADEHARHLITRYLQANGLGTAAEIAYLLKDTKPIVAAALRDMASGGELLEVQACGHRYYALPRSLELLGKPLARRKLKILSPFDNLLIQRKRMQRLFEFDYLIECYVPREKRRHGYFTLPVLWDGRLAARMDCKADRPRALLHIHHLALEPWLAEVDAFCAALRGELGAFLRFQACDGVQLHRTTPSRLKGRVARAIER